MPTALVLGCANGVQEDARKAIELFTPDAVCAVNDIGIIWSGRLDYWCSLHRQRADCWPGVAEARKRREQNGYNRPEFWTHKRDPNSDRFTGYDWGGSSGLFAVAILLQEEKFDKIVLAGVPMVTKAAHYYSEKIWNAAATHRNAWKRKKEILKPFVRSMSGWTMDEFGFPDRDWLQS